MNKYFLFLLKPWLNYQSRNFFRQFVGVNKLFFDIGANRGNRTEVFRQLGVNVVAVEPQRKCISILNKKFKKDPRVIIIQKGVGEKQGKMSINICSAADTISTFSKQWITEGRFKNFNFDGTEEVEMTTLDILIKKYGIPDFIKIDVEGYESEVINGLSVKVPYLNFEFSGEFFNNTKKCLEQLEMVGFSSFNLIFGEKIKFNFDTWIDKAGLINYLEKQIASDMDVWGDVYAK